MNSDANEGMELLETTAGLNTENIPLGTGRQYTSSLCYAITVTS
jgi:hypothetical protein